MAVYSISILQLTALLTTFLVGFYALYYASMLIAAKNLGSRRLGHALKPRKITVVVPTYNEAGNLRTKVANLLAQTYPRELMELIVVDGASTDGTVEIASVLTKELAGVVPIRVLQIEERKGKSYQMNLALAAARGEIIIATDADVVLDNGAISTLMSHFDDERVGAVSGKQSLVSAASSAKYSLETGYRGIYEVLRLGESNLHSTPIFHGGLCAYRATAVMPIREDLNADDTQFALQAVRAGFRSLYEPDSVFYTVAPSGTKSNWSQRVRRGQGLVRTFYYNRDMIFNRRFQRFGLCIFPAEFFMHIISPILTFLVSAMWLVSLATAGDNLPLPFSLALFILALLIGTLTILGKGKTPFRKRISVIPSFLAYQAALVIAIAMFALGKRLHIWEKVAVDSVAVAELHHERDP